MAWLSYGVVVMVYFCTVGQISFALAVTIVHIPVAKLIIPAAPRLTACGPREGGPGHLTPRWTPWMHVSALDASGVTDCEMPLRFALPLAGMGDCLQEHVGNGQHRQTDEDDL